LDETSLERAERYRAHAEEIRSAAMDIKHPESRAALFRLAVTYERLAERLESEIEPPVDIESDL
jgi:crotonobetainyl-CoA:carnitine CoA-transferase CaiB-like acyl-CoA transferase